MMKLKLIGYVLILIVLKFASSDKSELLLMLQKAAGVYSDNTKSVGELKNSVLITACNYGFINHLQNFKCFTERLGMKFLVIAMDKQAHDYITQNTTMSSYLMSGGVVGEVTGESTDFRSKQFNLITARKKEAVHDILQLGFNVLFSDTDVAMIRDPLPYMIWNNVDYVHSLNYMCKVNEPWDFYKSKIEGNTGFYFVRSTKNTIKLWADAFAAAPKYPKLDDQAIFWKVIRASKDPTVLPLSKCRHFDLSADVKGEKLVSCMLDTCVFSSGMISRQYVPELTYEMLLKNLHTLNETIATMHANYISGNRKKMLRMKEYGFWLADNIGITKDPNHCLPYVSYESTHKVAFPAE